MEINSETERRPKIFNLVDQYTLANPNKGLPYSLHYDFYKTVKVPVKWYKQYFDDLDTVCQVTKKQIAEYSSLEHGDLDCQYNR